MAYGLRYYTEFNDAQQYRLELYEKDYVGSDSYILLANGGLVHNWQTDEPKAAIKGSSLTVTFIVGPELPIITFYSPNDDQFKARLYWGGQLIFEGFLVQDDCQEVKADYKHTIVLSFNDNLGLLKDVALDENVPDFGGFPAGVQLDFVAPITTNYVYLYNTNFVPAVGVPFTITGHVDPSANATFTPLAVVAFSGYNNWRVEVAPLSFIDSIAFPALVTGAATIDVMLRNTLLNIIRICLYNTGLELNTRIYANIFEIAQTTDRCFLEQTYIDAQSFISTDEYMDCYAVLTSILERFNLSLFQANGYWNIVRWDEVRYYPITHDVPFFEYGPDFSFVGTGTLLNNFLTGFRQSIYPEVGLSNQISRPFKYTKETFNYKQPKNLLKNYDLQSVGAILATYADGANTVTEYEMLYWYPGNNLVAPNSYFIRVVRDALGNELERYAVVSGPPSTVVQVVGSAFEVSTGDKVQVDITFKTTKSQVGPGTLLFAVELNDGTTKLYADENPLVNWSPSLGWTYLIASGDDTNTSHTVTINPGRIPFDGVIFVYLPQADLGAGVGDETRITDIRVTYTPYINESTKIIGQIHNTQQALTIKNNEAVDLAMDDSPRNSIGGTLFLPGFSGVVQIRTLNWYRLINPSERLRIGRITTLEQLFWRRIPRTRLEGTYYGLQNISPLAHVSMLAVIQNIAYPGINFIFGTLQIDYTNNSFSGTQWELCTDSEIDSDLSSVYTFSYIYDSK